MFLQSLIIQLSSENQSHLHCFLHYFTCCLFFHDQSLRFHHQHHSEELLSSFRHLDCIWNEMKGNLLLNYLQSMTLWANICLGDRNEINGSAYFWNRNSNLITQKWLSSSCQYCAIFSRSLLPKLLQ